ncbi:sugar transferase [Ruegeria pomeroyi]|uniref:Sugar transferase n=1 Tax=Ruegeria alba TaxID=2916756 RepID=A0ABS9NWB1_9RHOB|nr:sugar transferase [Ruegeria alba]MCE8521790.1 sugar transferase [Ruegeria pomeroyi]MCE8526394.1 sugar transferase [Ruegeria pomeroyi]MCE8534410.1 sugar transferase [Ruegeria pomeroyi]MCE8547333.1 sugar transferase [Ruegeria pomeroyi]MCG6558511.1 sugar transferase [Ruegeria alba]
MKDYIYTASLAVPVASGQADQAKGMLETALLPANTIAPPEKLGGDVSPANGIYAAVGKRFLDVAFIVLSLPVSLLIIAFCALALRLEGGDAFYRQPRLGRDGKLFYILKLRTMVMDADAQLEKMLAEDPVMRAEWDATQKLKDDPRITPVGNFLRRTSLDELPQLWNVLTGDMSLVGPRPMMPDQLPLYGPAESYFALRPGITGLWQVSERNNSRFDYRSKVDADYARTVSLIGDLSLLLRTTSVVVRRTGC